MEVLKTRGGHGEGIKLLFVGGPDIDSPIEVSPNQGHFVRLSSSLTNGTRRVASPPDTGARITFAGHEQSGAVTCGPARAAMRVDESY